LKRRNTHEPQEKKQFTKGENVVEIVSIIVDYLSQNKCLVYGNWLCRRWQWECRHRYVKCQDELQCEQFERRHNRLKYNDSNEKCRHKLRCSDESYCRWKRFNGVECPNEMQFEYTRELFKEYLKTPKVMCDLFMWRCEECYTNNLVSSFSLQKLYVHEKNPIYVGQT